MGIAAIIATVVAAIIGALLAPWWSRKLQAKHQQPAPAPSDAAGIETRDFSKLPISVQDPAIQDAAHQFFVREYGHAPSRKELYDILNSMIIDKQTVFPTKEEVDRVMEDIRKEDEG